MRLKIIVWFWFLLCSVLVQGQIPYFHTIDKTSGLPSNSVYDIFQDSRGFMWFATNKGLCRFDGMKFISYTSDKQTSVAGSSISEDSFGRIWYCNFDGYLYYVENGKLCAFNQPETIGYFRYGIIKNHLYLVQKNKLLVYDLKDFSIVATHKIEGEKIYTAFSDNTKFYVLSDYFYGFSSGKQVNRYAVPENLHKNYRSAILQQTQGGLVIFSKFSNSYYLLQNGTFTEKKLAGTMQFIQNAVFIDGQIWVCTTNGIFKNSLSESPEKRKNYFSDYNTSSVFKDKDGNYWISTLNRGLLLVEDFDLEYIHVDNRPILLDFMQENILISTEKDALYLFSPKDKSLSKFYQGTNNHEINQLLVDNQTQKIFFTSSSFKVMNFQKQIEKEAHIAVKDISKINDKYFSFAGSYVSGIFPINSSIIDQKWGNISRKYKVQQELQGSELFENVNGKSTIFNTENQTIYYATNVGLFAQKSANNHELFFNGDKLYILKLVLYKDIVLALSTSGKVYSISKENKILALDFLTNKEDNRIFKIKVIDHLLFLFGEKNLFEYHFISKKIRKVISGSTDLDITDLVLYHDKMIFTTSKGLLIQSFQNRNKNLVPKLIINQILVNNQPENSLRNLKNQQNNINIQFSVLSFVPNVKTNVFYRINNKEWQLLDNENRNLMLNSLSFGKYKVDFKVQIDEKFSKIQSVSFEIGKPFWFKTWFILLLFTAVSLFIYVIFKSRIKKIRAKNQLILDRINLENNVNQSKLKAIKSQMNPHFFYNALNTIQSYILSNERKTAVNYLSKFSLLTRTILEMTEKDWVTISEEIKTISLYLEIEKARFNDDFEYEIRSEENSDFENLKIPSMLLQPYIENAVKHGLLHKKEAKQLLISFEKQEGNIVISIDDNGIGRKKSGELNAIKVGKPQSFATEAMQKRIDLLNQNKTTKITLTYIDKINNAEMSLGTTVVIKIPQNP